MSQNLQALLVPLAFLALMYFLMIRPQQQQQKKRQSMLGAVKRNDRVVTIGGLHGQVIDLTEETVTLRVAKDVELTFNRSAIGTIKAEGS